MNKLKNKLLFSENEKPIEPSIKQTPGQPESYKKYIDNCLTEKAWPVTMKMIQVFKQEAEETGAVFMLYDYIRFAPNIAGKYTNDDLKQFCNTNNIPYIRIYEEFEAIKKSPLRKKYILKDGHPTSLGNKMFSQILGNKLRKYLVKVAP